MGAGDSGEPLHSLLLPRSRGGHKEYSAFMPFYAAELTYLHLAARPDD